MICSFKQVSLLLAATASVAAAAVVNVDQRDYPTCAAENCFARAIIPSFLVPEVEDFCYQYLHTRRPTTTITATAKATVTGTSTVTNTATITATAVNTNIQTQTVTTTATVTSATVCQTTATVTDLQNVVAYSVRGQAPSAIQKRATPSDVAVLAAAPVALVHGCKADSLAAKVSAACQCFLKKVKPKSTTVTMTQTATATSLTTVAATATTAQTVQTTVVVTVTSAVTVTTATCSSTQTVTAYDLAAFTCGIPNPTATGSGTITCPDVAPPGETNARFRIEGGTEGTVYEDCIASGPTLINTPSGGSHECDGTNNNANPSPGATLITQINAAAQQVGFTYDGTFDSIFDDFFISRISSTSESNDQFWGVLEDLALTPSGGCETESRNGHTGLWAFDVFNKNFLLKLEPEYQVIHVGEAASVTLTVSGVSVNGGPAAPVAGATIDGQTSDSSGNVQLAVPLTPGCYQFKAERFDSIRSNAFYLTVLPPAA